MSDTVPTPPSIDDAVAKQRRDDFVKELDALCQKHNMVIVPVMEYTRFGAVPQWLPVTKEEYETVMNKVVKGG